MTDNSSSQQEVQTYTFQVPDGSPAAGGPAARSARDPRPRHRPARRRPPSPATTPSVDADSGALRHARSPLPTYNPNVPGRRPRPTTRWPPTPGRSSSSTTLDPSLGIPTKVSAKLTFNGIAGTTYYYDTSQFIPGDVQQIALQANATGLTTGRYGYSASVGRRTRHDQHDHDRHRHGHRAQRSGSAFGAGWTLQGLERITTATGGRDPRPGRRRQEPLVHRQPGSGGGTYTDPAGEF